MNKDYKVYYDEEKDALMLTRDSKVVVYEESISSSDSIRYDSENIDELKDMDSSDVLELFETIIADGESNLSKEEVEEHMKFLQTVKPSGEIIKEFRS